MDSKMKVSSISFFKKVSRKNFLHWLNSEQVVWKANSLYDVNKLLKLYLTVEQILLHKKHSIWCLFSMLSFLFI